MSGKTHIGVVFNEPNYELESLYKELVQTPLYTDGPEAVTQEMRPKVDLSEVGILDASEHVREALVKAGYRVTLFNMTPDITRLIKFLREDKPDLIFNMCESLIGQGIHEMHVAGIYELLGVPYTGSAALTLGTCLQKGRTKKYLSYHGIPTPKFVMIAESDKINADEFPLRFPMFVKPAFEDASVGIDNASVVRDFTELKRRVKRVHVENKQAALVEEYIDGRELNIAIIGNKKPVALPISEIDFSGLPEGYPKIVTYNAKWVESTREFIGTKGTCPANLPPDVAREVKAIALKAYALMECRDYARVDIRLSRENVPYVLEVNPNPDISSDAGFMRSARQYGLEFEQAIARIAEVALERVKG